MKFRRISHSPVSPAGIQLLPDAPTSPKREEGKKKGRERGREEGKEGGKKGNKEGEKQKRRGGS